MDVDVIGRSPPRVDARFAPGDYFLSGLLPNAGNWGDANAAVVAHGTNTTNTARLVLFANNPLLHAPAPLAGPALTRSRRTRRSRARARNRIRAR